MGGAELLMNKRHAHTVPPTLATVELPVCAHAPSLCCRALWMEPVACCEHLAACFLIRCRAFVSPEPLVSPVHLKQAAASFSSVITICTF